MSSQRTIFKVMLGPKSVFKKNQVRYTSNNITLFVGAVINDIVLLPQNIPADKQRLIFKGKVLQDDKKLSEYGMMLLFYTLTCRINFNWCNFVFEVKPDISSIIFFSYTVKFQK